MKRICLILISCLVLLFFLIPVITHPPVSAGSTLTTRLLSDHTQTVADSTFNKFGYGLEVSGSLAHVFWQESGNGSEGTDLFYRQLPDGNTVLLSAPTLSEGNVSLVWFDTAVAPDGTFHMIWVENTGTSEADDLFYWSAATGTILLTSRAQTEGFVQPATNTLSIVLDSIGNPHVIWFENTGTSEGTDLFYWNQTAGTRLLSNRGQTEGDSYTFGPTRLLTDGNGTPHITWAEYGNDEVTPSYFYWNPSLANPTILPRIGDMTVTENRAHIFWLLASEGPLHYWNSTTTTDTTIPSSTNPIAFFIAKPRIFAGNNDSAHLYWGEPGTGTCLSSWDSVSQITKTLASGENCEPYWALATDSNGRFHAIVPDFPSGSSGVRIKYWNSNLADSIIVKSTANVDITNVTLSVQSSSTPAHITWMETSSNYLNDDFFHWDNINKTALNLSDLAGADTKISSTSPQTQINEAGQLFVLWSEQIAGSGTSQYLYWNSVSQTTQNLFTKLAITSLHPVLNRLYLYLQAGGMPYIIWHGKTAAGPTGFYVWDGKLDEINSAGEGSICSGFANGTTSDGNFYLSWQDETTFANYFWDKNNGPLALNVTSAAETTCLDTKLKISEDGRVFILWTENSDNASEGVDLYAGWLDAPNPPTEIDYNLYLPFSMK